MRAGEEPVEVVSYRVRGGRRGGSRWTMLKLGRKAGTLADALLETRADVRSTAKLSPRPVYQREKLDAGLTLHGPAVLDQFDCTTVICAGQIARVDEWKNLIVTEMKP